MRTISLISIILLFRVTAIYCQNHFGNEWITGFGYKFNFSTVPPSHDTFFQNNGSTLYSHGASCISDSSGFIVLNCDGMDLRDRNGVLIEGGDSLVPKNYYNHEQGYSLRPQTSIILPMENRKYYLVTPTVSDDYFTNIWPTKPALNWNFDLLLYHVIDLNANAGAGKVIQRKVALMENTPMKKTQMMACRHANGKDWWLLKMAGDTNMVFTFLFTQDSVYKYPRQYIPFPLKGANDSYGQMQFSEDGTKWATTCNWAPEISYAGAGEVFAADFDRCTGLLSNYKKYVAPGVAGDTINTGLAFSPNGKLLYVSKFSAIQQLDLDLGTWFTVHGPDSPAFFCGYVGLHLAPDHKIYIGRFDGICKQWSVINSPDTKINCDFCVNCMRSKSVNGYFNAPPTMPNYELGAQLPCWPLANADMDKAKMEFEIYPNPTSRQLYIISESKAKKELYNSVGQLLYTTMQNEIDLRRYTKGVYYLKVQTAVKKFVID